MTPTNRTRESSTSRLKPEIRLRKPKAPRKAVKAIPGLPPVLVRNGSSFMPAAVPQRGQTKRRLDLTLPVQGAQASIRLPSLPQVHFGARLLSGLLALLMAGLLYALWTQPTFRVEAVDIKGLQRVTPQDVNTVLGVHGESIFMLDSQKLQDRLVRSFPEMALITVTVDLPAAVSVAVVERQPIISWKQDGREYWVDAQGMAFPPRGQAGELVQVEGKVMLPASVNIKPEDANKAIQLLSPDQVKAILDMSAQAPKKATLIFDTEHGLGWDDGKWKVYFGMDAGNMDMKLQVYKALVKRLKHDGIEPTFISVEYLYAPYYRVER